MFSYLSSTGEVIEYSGFIPDCESVIGAVRVEAEIWFALVRDGEWGPYDGSGILIYDVHTKEKKHMRPEGLSSAVIYAIAHQPDRNAVWLTTQWGIERYSVSTKTWERRYFKPMAAPDNKLTTALVKRRPDIGEMWMLYHLQLFSIRDREGFARTWRSLGLEFTGEELPVPIRNDKLLPYYP